MRKGARYASLFSLIVKKLNEYLTFNIFLWEVGFWRMIAESLPTGIEFMTASSLEEVGLKTGWKANFSSQISYPVEHVMGLLDLRLVH